MIVKKYQLLCNRERIVKICVLFKKGKKFTLFDPDTKVRMIFENQNGFTIKEVFKHIETFEHKSRLESDWFGDIYAHRIFFEWLRYDKKNKAYVIGCES